MASTISGAVSFDAKALNMPVKLRIPNGVTFADLQLRRRGDGDLSFNAEVLEEIYTFSELPKQPQSENATITVIVRWYIAHRSAGGELDPVMEDFLLKINN
jgi:hypothetical protein